MVKIHVDGAVAQQKNRGAVGVVFRDEREIFQGA
jgi:ribonuclease HI